MEPLFFIFFRMSLYVFPIMDSSMLRFLAFEDSPLAVLRCDLGNEETDLSAFRIHLGNGSGNMLPFEQGCLIDRHAVAIARDIEPEAPATVAGNVRKHDISDGVARVGNATCQFPPPLRREPFIFFNKFPCC